MNTRAGLIETVGEVLHACDHHNIECRDPFPIPATATAIINTLMPIVESVQELLHLPEGSLVIGRKGIAWGRGKNHMQLWRAFDGGGYGSSSGDLMEITQRFYRNEGPFTVVWTP